jgi:hypothetical protein
MEVDCNIVWTQQGDSDALHIDKIGRCAVQGWLSRRITALIILEILADVWQKAKGGW